AVSERSDGRIRAAHRPPAQRGIRPVGNVARDPIDASARATQDGHDRSAVSRHRCEDRRRRNGRARASGGRSRRAVRVRTAGDERLLEQTRRNPDALRKHADGRIWFHTGDVARMDDEGFTSIVQRKKDMIIVDGYNVYPSEVESVLYMHQAVRLAAVIGIPDAYHGEVVKACIALKPDTTASADQP